MRELMEMIQNPNYSESVRNMMRSDFGENVRRRSDPLYWMNDQMRKRHDEVTAMGQREKTTFEGGLDATSSGQLAILRDALKGGRGISGPLTQGRGSVSMSQLLQEAGINASPQTADRVSKRIPRYQNYGVARRPQIALIGEKEDEAVIPARLLSEFGGEDLLQRLESGVLPRSEDEQLDAEYDAEFNDMLDASGAREDFMGQMESEKPEGFWESVAMALGPQPTAGRVDMRGGKGGLGALAAMAGIFANMQAGKGAREIAGRVRRNEQRVTMERERQRQSAAMERGVRMERMRRLGSAREFNRQRDLKLGDEAQRFENESIEIPGYGRFPKTTNLAQSYVSQKSGIPIRAERTAEDARPSPVVSSIGEDEAKREYDTLVDSYRRRYWESRFGNSPEQYAMYSRSDIPESEIQKMNADPKVVAARNRWQASTVIRKARNARSLEDLQDIKADLERLPPEVDNDPRVLSAISDAVNRVR